MTFEVMLAGTPEVTMEIGMVELVLVTGSVVSDSP